jgi:hypothetical protein
MPVRLVEALRPTAATLSAGVATPQAQAGPLAVGKVVDGGEAVGHKTDPSSINMLTNKVFFIVMYINTKTEINNSNSSSCFKISQ